MEMQAECETHIPNSESPSNPEMDTQTNFTEEVMDFRQLYTKQLFSVKDIPEMRSFFPEAAAGGLTIAEFCDTMQKMDSSLDRETLTALHMKIDTNCHRTVDYVEFWDYLSKEKRSKEKMIKSHKFFPKPLTFVPVDHCKTIVHQQFIPFQEGANSNDDSADGVSRPHMRTYQKGLYISLSKDGMLNFWDDSFTCLRTMRFAEEERNALYYHRKKFSVNDAVYMNEVSQLAIATPDMALLFYNYDDVKGTFSIDSKLIGDNTATVLNYWSDGTRAVFSFGDNKGSISVFISHNVKKYGLFDSALYSDTSVNNCQDIRVSWLMRNTAKNFFCFQVAVHNQECINIRLLPSLNVIATCSNGTMVLTSILKSPQDRVRKIVFNSLQEKDFFSCFDCVPEQARLVTGGTDGIVRVWAPPNVQSCLIMLTGHSEAISHIAVNSKDKICVSISTDNNIRVWNIASWNCLQSINVPDIGHTPISSVCYSTDNNVLVVANTNIGQLIGRGTDLFRSLTTQAWDEKPLSCVLYHRAYNQVVAGCSDGVVTVWDIPTGKIVAQFSVCPNQPVAITAMSFDENQRQLVTASKDGKLKYWNFNIGEELRVLPITVPGVVTHIFCNNERMYVLTESSRVILDLDLVHDKHRFLEHDYLEDISSMAVDKTWLVTTSSNGYTVIWNTTTADAHYWFSSMENPRMYLLGDKLQGRTVRFTSKCHLMTTKAKRGMDKCKTQTTLHLQTREDNVYTATLLISTDCHIAAWSMKYLGGLLGIFKAVQDNAVITVMSTDQQEKILLIGDNTGKIYLWDIQSYCLEKETANDPSGTKVINGWKVSLRPPPLLNSWQAHQKGLLSLSYVTNHKAVITAGLDSNVCLWTSTGRCIGIFGKDLWSKMDIDLLNSVAGSSQEQTETAKADTLCHTDSHHNSLTSSKFSKSTNGLKWSALFQPAQEEDTSQLPTNGQKNGNDKTHCHIQLTKRTDAKVKCIMATYGRELKPQPGDTSNSSVPKPDLPKQQTDRTLVRGVEPLQPETNEEKNHVTCNMKLN